MSSLKLLGPHGDITIGWEDSDNVKMEKLIIDLLAQGHTIFIRKGFLGGKKKLNSIRELNSNKIILKDATANEMIRSMATATVIEDKEDTMDVVPSTDAKEIAKSDSVVVPTAVGG